MNQTIEEVNNNLREIRDRLDVSISLSEKAASTLRNIFKEKVLEDNPTNLCQYGTCDGSGYVDRDGKLIKCGCWTSIEAQMDDNSNE